MKKLAFTFIAIAGFLTPLLAQVPPPGGIPFDPVSGVLLVAGGVIAGKKLYSSRKKG